MLTWKTLSSDNLLLCQFMVNYEMRQGEYLVAFNAKDNIVACGLLIEDGTNQASVDVVVAPNSRRQGIGRQLVRKLIASAREQNVTRLVAHNVPEFWQAFDFVAIDDAISVLVLENAVNELVNVWHTGIPMTEFMGLSINLAQPNHLITKANMSRCINVHQSMFAGAIYSQAVLTGWGLIHLALIRYGLEGDIVLAHGDVKYRRPLLQDPCGEVNHALNIADFADLRAGKKCGIELLVKMKEGASDRACAIFTGRYVILPKN